MKLYLTAIFNAVLLSLPLTGFSGTQVFSNTNYITINDSTSPPTIATPYPSSITVTGLNGQFVTKATVTLQGFSHTFPSDVDIILQSPDGQMSVLMSEVGGLDQDSVTNLILTLDDAASSSLPLDTTLVSGTFKPTARHSPLLFDFPPPLPAGNSNAAVALSVFQNTDPNGTWSLFVVDDTASNDGYIANGWSLSLTTSPILLQIHAADSSHAVVSWPSGITNCTLQAASNLVSSTWTDVVNPPVLVSGQLAVTNPIAGRAFFRLRQGN